MSFLAPLYALGLLALSLPVIFHFIRRAPRGSYDFSALMFLSPSPPRLTRRSRLDHLLLLILRGLVLVLLALAFARPFFQTAVLADAGDGQRRRTAILVDTSASMRRADLWMQATESILRTMAECRPQDQPAVFLCDEHLRPLAGFEELSQLDPSERRALVERRLISASPTWSATHLGQGLMDAVQIASDMPAADTKDIGRTVPHVVVVSDFQEGARLETLVEHQWPTDLQIELRPVRAAETTNAGLHRLERSLHDIANAAESVRVRVSNDRPSTAEQFQLAWVDADGRDIGETTDVHVPAGESRVVRVARPEEKEQATRLELRGDAHRFDNSLYFADSKPVERMIGYLGGDVADDPENLHYYLERALSSLGPSFRLVNEDAAPLTASNAPDSMPLVIVAKAPTEPELHALRQYVENGGTLLYVLTAAEQGESLAELFGLPTLVVEEAAVADYTMLGQIDFNHPLFAPMSGPQFNDFTQIHFWKYRRIDAAALRDAAVLAKFENGDPAIIESRLGEGAMYVLTSGWHPADSQLARSWKFVPLVATLARQRDEMRLGRAHFQVNEPVPLSSSSETGKPPTITKPDGRTAELSDDAASFAETDQPGLYSIVTADRTRRFAVNLDPLESKTAMLGPAEIQQLGLPLVTESEASTDADHRQRLHDAQLESRQKIWQWLLAGALGLVIAETWLAGRLSQHSMPEANAV